MTSVKSISAEFVGFLLVGISSTILSLLTRALINQVLPFEIAVAASHIAGMIFSFTMNRVFVFRTGGQNKFRSFYRFALINAMSLAITTCVSSFVYRIALPLFALVDHTELISHIIGLGACTLPSFIGHKFYSFASPGGGRNDTPRANQK